MNSKIKIILIVSIVLNFLFTGVLIGNISKRYVHERPPHQDFIEITKKLPPQKQKLVEDKFNTLREEHEEVRAEIRESKKEIADILRAPEFDEKLYDRKISEMHGLYRGKAKQMAATIKELAMQFTQEERAVLAEMLEQRHKKHWHKDKK